MGGHFFPDRPVLTTVLSDILVNANIIKDHTIVQTLNRSWLLWQQGADLLLNIFLKLYWKNEESRGGSKMDNNDDKDDKDNERSDRYKNIKIKKFTSQVGPTLTIPG